MMNIWTDSCSCDGNLLTQGRMINIVMFDMVVVENSKDMRNNSLRPG